MRGFLRECIGCTWCIAIGSVGLGKTLKEIRSLKKDKSWYHQGGLAEKTSKSRINDKEGAIKQIKLPAAVLIKL
jgi:hypothetical protein